MFLKVLLMKNKMLKENTLKTMEISLLTMYEMYRDVLKVSIDWERFVHKSHRDEEIPSNYKQMMDETKFSMMLMKEMRIKSNPSNNLNVVSMKMGN